MVVVVVVVVVVAVVVSLELARLYRACERLQHPATPLWLCCGGICLEGATWRSKSLRGNAPTWSRGSIASEGHAGCVNAVVGLAGG